MTGAETKVGIGLEGTAATPVRSQQLLYHRSDSVEAEYNNITSRALTSGRFPGKSAAGNANIGGSIVVEPTFSDIQRILYAAMGAYTKVDDVGPWKNKYTVAATGPRPLTHTIAKGVAGSTGAIIQVHKGCIINQLVLAADLDEYLLATLDLIGRGEKVYQGTTVNETALFGTAALSADVAPTYTMGSVALNGASTCEVRNWTLTLNNQMREKRALCQAAGRFAAGYSPGMVEVTFDANLYFSTDAERRRYMGVAYNAPYPYEATNEQIDGAASLGFSAPTQRSISINLPRLQYLTAPAPVESDDFIMQSVTMRALYDAGTGGMSVQVDTDTDPGVATSGAMTMGTNLT